ncbi:MAG: disulfide bond formation protein B, partial [Paracoccaceae bacterium]
IGGLAPCKMCIWQRWPHGIAIALGLLVALVPLRILALAGGVVVALGAAIGFYHAGVEWGFFAGPDTCTSNPIGEMSVDDLFAQIVAAPVVRCDEIPWSLMGLSMAGWNAVLSAALALLWLRSFFLTWK